jgi:DNA-binding beta-propeller fold protein YncE
MKRALILMLVFAVLLAPAGTAGSAGASASVLSAAHIQSASGKLNVRLAPVSLTANDLIYDPLRDKIYASVPSSAAQYANHVVAVNPYTGALSSPIFAGSSPNKLALSADGQYLYVGIDGAASVRRINLETQTAEIQFPLGSGDLGLFLAEDMVVLLDNPHAVAVSRRNSCCSPRHEGVAIYDDGVKRPDETSRHTGSNRIEPSDSSAFLYGYNNETTEFGLRVMEVYTDGVRVESISYLLSGFYQDITFDPLTGLIYAGSGAVYDPKAGGLAGTYAASGLVYPDSPKNRVFFLTSSYGSSAELKVFNQSQYTLLDSFPITMYLGNARTLVSAGEDRLAVLLEDGSVYLLSFYELQQTFLPLARRTCNEGICGKVTHNGPGIAYQSLDLRFFDGAKWSTVANTFSDGTGYYKFTGVPSLQPGQVYYVLYLNKHWENGKLWVWATPDISSYISGEARPLADFDILDIELVAPADRATVSLPYQFQWKTRPATPTDMYEFNLYDYTDEDPYFYSPLLGYQGSYTLHSLPPGFVPGVYYGWDVWAYSPEGGFGVSFWTREVAFGGGLSNSSLSQENLSARLLEVVDERILQQALGR